MKRVATGTKKVAMPPVPGEAPVGDAGPVDAAPTGMPGEPGMPGMEEGAPGEEASEIVQLLDVIKELAEGRLPAADAVEAIQGLVGQAPVGPEGEMAPGAEAGAPEPSPMDVGGPGAGGPVAKRIPFSALLDKLAKEYANKINKRGTMATKREAELQGGEKPKGQYPDWKPQGDPPQSASAPSHYKMHKSRPAKDFDGDASEYGKLWNIDAEFIPNSDRRLAGWKISDDNTPLFMVTGAGAWEEMLDQKWAELSAREYGEQLVRAILNHGLESTMEEVSATAVKAVKKTADTDLVLDPKLVAAAEAKANDLADERVAAFQVRFLEGIKVAFDLQSKNVIDNPIKAAAYDVLTAAGLDGELAEKVADSEIVQTHFEGAIKEALKYTEMAPESFEQVKAHVASLPATKVVEAIKAGKSSDEVEEVIADVALAQMRKRASANIGGVRPSKSDSLAQGFDEKVRTAVRSGVSRTARLQVPTNSRPTFAKPGARAIG